MLSMNEHFKKITYKHPMPETNSALEFILWRFKELGITMEELATIVFESQKGYYEYNTNALQVTECEEAIKKVLLKREIQQVLLTAINLDIMSEQGLLLEPLQTMVYTDQGTFGVDEVLIHSAQLFGAIGIANAFQLDKDKPGIIGRIDKMGKSTTYSCTFLDDILCVVCGSAMGKIAHSHGLEEEEKRNLPKSLELLSQF